MLRVRYSCISGAQQLSLVWYFYRYCNHEHAMMKHWFVIIAFLLSCVHNIPLSAVNGLAHNLALLYKQQEIDRLAVAGFTAFDRAVLEGGKTEYISSIALLTVHKALINPHRACGVVGNGIQFVVYRNAYQAHIVLEGAAPVAVAAHPKLYDMMSNVVYARYGESGRD